MPSSSAPPQSPSTLEALLINSSSNSQAEGDFAHVLDQLRLLAADSVLEGLRADRAAEMEIVNSQTLPTVTLGLAAYSALALSRKDNLIGAWFSRMRWWHRDGACCWTLLLDDKGLLCRWTILLMVLLTLILGDLVLRCWTMLFLILALCC